MGVGRSIDEKEKPKGELPSSELAKDFGHCERDWTNECTGCVDSRCPRVGAIEPLRLWKTKETITGHSIEMKDV